MDGTSKYPFPSTNSTLFVDEPTDFGIPSMKQALSVDEPTDFGIPSMKQAQIVDGMTLKSTGEPETKQRVKVTACR